MNNNNHESGYEIVPFPRIRNVVVEVLIPARRKHTINGLFEADVTRVRRHIRKHKAETGQSISFTAFLIKCVGTAAQSNKRLHARRISPGRLAIFDDVHVGFTVETEVDGQSHPLATVINCANRKSVGEIHAEIRAYQAGDREKEIGTLRKFAKLPQIVRGFLMSRMNKQPATVMKSMGTVLVTSVGMFGAGGGWVIPLSDFSLAVGVGGITRKPGISSDDRIEPREFLSVTCNFDHDITDGAPAARFAQELKELIERGHGLLD